MMRKVKFILSFLLISWSSLGQRVTIDELVKKIQDHQQNTLQEKIFIHLDRTFYVGGEIMWFKVYLLDGYVHQALDLSKVVYVDVLDRNQLPVIQTKVSIENGKGNGSISVPASLPSDNYILRAYTSWMKNFSTDFFFQQTISVANVFQRLEDKNKGQLNAPDAQFFPEGGNLVDGIKSKVAFRVVDSSGKGISFTGTVLNNKGDTLVFFKPLKFGIGHFILTPKKEEEYRVVLKDKNGRVTIASLPSVQPYGYTLSVIDTTLERIKVTISGKGINGDPIVYLIGHTRQLVKACSIQKLLDGKVTILLTKKELGAGIVHLTLFNERLQPLCERLYFHRPTAVPLQLTSDKISYEPRNKITLQINSNASQTRLINASLSVIKNDSLQQICPIDIQSYLWLSSELKGNLESPEYYFSRDKDVDNATDNLMLTHGWSKFNWEEILRTEHKPILFIPEYRGQFIRGKILDAHSSKPVQGVSAYLGTPDKKIQPYMTRSDSSGQFLFETFHLIGRKKLIAQTNINQNSIRIEFESPFSKETSSIKIPFLKLSESLAQPLTQRSISMQTEDIFYKGRVKKSTQTADSSAFYGKASENYRLDDFTRFPVMEEVMREYVKGVRVIMKDNKPVLKGFDARKNKVFENDPLILLDGVPVFNMDKIMDMDPLKIKSIDVVTSRYFYGEFNFDGIISLRSYQPDLGGFQFDPGTIILDYDGLQEKKEFYAPRYETILEKQRWLPDQRNLLHWLADIDINKPHQSIDFYSSDQSGVFQAILQGISQYGQPVYQTCTFEVKPTYK